MPGGFRGGGGLLGAGTEYRSSVSMGPEPEPENMDPKLPTYMHTCGFFGEVYATYIKGSGKKCALWTF